MKTFAKHIFELILSTLTFVYCMYLYTHLPQTYTVDERDMVNQQTQSTISKLPNSSSADFATQIPTLTPEPSRLLVLVDTKLKDEPGEYFYYFKNLRTGEVVEYGDDQPYPPASTFKLYTALITLKDIEKSKLSWNTSVKYTEGLKSPGPGSYFKEEDLGKYFSVQNLLWRMIVQSDNTAQSMLFAIHGRANIETKLNTELGLEHTSLEEFETTVHDMASVVERLYKGQLLNEANTKYMLDLLEDTSIRDRIRAGLPKGTRVANKGGTLPGSKHDVAIVYAPNTEYILIVYSANVEEQRAVKNIEELSTITWNYVIDDKKIVENSDLLL